MPRRVRRTLLVAIAALAGCRLAAGHDGGACINSCDCHCSGSTAPPKPSHVLPTRDPRTLLGAALSPILILRECNLESATYSSKMCKNNESEVLDMVNKQWDSGNISVTNNLMVGDSKDPCFNNTKNLRINVTGNFCRNVNNLESKCNHVWFLADAWENTVINLRNIATAENNVITFRNKNTIKSERIDCVTRRKKLTPVGRRKA